MTNKTGILTSLLILCSTVALAKQIEVKGNPIALSQPGEYYLAPQWSPSGDQLAVGGPSYTGLYLLDFPSGNVQQLSNNYSAGYGFAWSHDGSRVASKISHFNKMRRFHTLVSFNVSDGTMQTLSAPHNRMSGKQVWTSDDSHIYLNYAEKFELFTVDDSRSEQNISSLHYVRDGRLQKRTSSLTTTTEIPLFLDQDHISSYAVSPDGSHVVYSTSGQNLWLAEINGDNRIRLGSGIAPSWSPNSEWIVYMLTEDDGHKILNSDVYIISIKEKSPLKITETPDINEMHPQWSPGGDWIAYDTDELGQIFIQQIGWR